MFIRSKIVNGTTYYQVVNNYRRCRDPKHPTQKVIVSLGRHPTIEAAYQEAETRYFRSRLGRENSPMTKADDKLWSHLCDLNWAEHRVNKTEGVTEAWAKEFKRLKAINCPRRKRRTKAEKAADDAREADENRRFFDDMFGGARSREAGPEHYAALDLPPPPTREQIRAARDRKARECHSDHGGSDAAMAAVNEAYERLLG
jgi:hypothetical protein